MATRLITIPFSHYCEKARWALDRVGAAHDEDGHLPLFHYLPVRRAGARRTVPVLIDSDRVIADSTDIVAWADARAPGALLPSDPADRAAALELEDDLDRQLGPATRRWAYFQLLPRRDLEHLVLHAVPRWERVALAAARPLVLRLLSRGLKIDAAGAERSRKKIDEAFARIDALVADGRRFLVGGRFSVADLTFASLAGPILLPPAYGGGRATIPSVDDFHGEARTRVEAWRASPAGRFALRLYETERTPVRRAA
ncbi:MAG TPA: glutathione S-transferase family protein [Kofleriaceae bacterium]|nr:glutathione S-transferase family protein [Kofleriaceae bacterium]